MRILQIAPRMPFPLTDGGAIGIYNITRSLAERGHDVTLVTFPLDDAAQNREAVADISRFATLRVTTEPLPPRWRVLLRTLFHGAYPIERRESKEFYAILQKLLATQTFDVVHVDHSHMAHYAEWLQRHSTIPVVLREHNYEAQIYERFAETERNGLKRAVARLHGRRLKHEEDKLLRSVDAVAAITESDAAIVRRVAPEARVSVIPAGVSLDTFAPTNAPVDPATILLVGSMEWEPNYDAACWFLDGILPLIRAEHPELRVEFIGGARERIAERISAIPGIIHHGQVPDVRDYLGRATVLVVPLRIGGGMRVKLLEFFALSKAVVSTSIGAEGNRAAHGSELLLADTSQDFARAVITLLRNRDLRTDLGRAARSLVEREYSWQHVGAMFEELYQSVLHRP